MRMEVDGRLSVQRYLAICADGVGGGCPRLGLRSLPIDSVLHSRTGDCVPGMGRGVPPFLSINDSEFERQVGKLKVKERVLLLVTRGRATIYLAITP